MHIWTSFTTQIHVYKCDYVMLHFNYQLNSLFQYETLERKICTLYIYIKGEQSQTHFFSTVPGSPQCKLK